jgi:hypothetical protein
VNELYTRRATILKKTLKNNKKGGMISHAVGLAESTL